MKDNFHFPIIICFLLALTACTPQPIQGVYQTDAQGGILMAGHRYEFLSNNRFKFRFWSDDINSNTIGHGTYSYNGKELTLNYADYPADASHFTDYPLEELDNGQTYYQFDISNHLTGNLIGVTIQLLDANGNPLVQGITDAKGKFNTSILKTQNVKQITISYIGMQSLQIDWNDRMSTGFSVNLVEQNQYVSAGTVETFLYKINGNQLTLKDGQRKRKLIRVANP